MKTSRHSVSVKVREKGCTLTPDYWKTHYSYGSGNYENAWSKILPYGENSIFYLSNQEYYKVLWTAPDNNVYYILSSAYIAAKLNVLNGANLPTTLECPVDSKNLPSDVSDSINLAESLFNKYTPQQISKLKESDNLRRQFMATASKLENYNNGYIGPGHCS
jgi:hypothetical protein